MTNRELYFRDPTTLELLNNGVSKVSEIGHDERQIKTLRFELEKLNELKAFWVGEEPKETQGFHEVLVSETYHPFWKYWWPQGHIIGWEHTFVHELTHFLDAIANNAPVAPHGATFEDGYRAAVICDAILESARTRRQVDIKYE